LPTSIAQRFRYGATASKLTRPAGRILTTAMRMAVPKELNHLPDDLLQQAVESLR